MAEAERVDRPLTVERLSPADLQAAGEAVATLAVLAHARTPLPGDRYFTLIGRWNGAEPGDWWVSVDAGNLPLDPHATEQTAQALLLPILRAIRPRAVAHHFRSVMDEATTADLGAIGMAGTMPSASAFEPRWVADRTVVRAGPYADLGPDAAARARAVLARIGAALGFADAPEDRA